ncbi:hypothetical protein E4T56_gene18153 [Termitomyces sp. T112]|nr:hypothetical protein E4T56_gene18153 [Termitomyces sp. T112]KAH0585371.1 hypothetical protein H2248_008608 [Termitomyces sp. 'cryptogamus']
MAHKFSNEIYSMIIDNLQAEVSTLRRMSLVNRAFAASSRSYIWRRVILKASPGLTPNHVSSCARFYEVLAGGVLTPAVADLVQEFCIDDTDFPFTLSTDVHLPLVLDGLTGLIRLDIFNMSLPTNNGHPLITSIRNILQSAILECVTIASSVLPTYLIDDCLAVRTLLLRGSYIADVTPSVPIVQDVETNLPQPQHMILNVDPEVVEDVWPRVDTSSLQSLLIPLPVYEEDMRIDGHALRCLGLNYMEDAADHAFPTFDSLANLRQLFIAFPTWIPAWPAGLADLLDLLNPLMQNLEQIHLYLLVEPADSLVNEDDQELHSPQDFRILDGQLARLRSPRMTQIHVALCPNSDPVTDVRGVEKVMTELPLTYARNILSVDVVAELPWNSLFRS